MSPFEALGALVAALDGELESVVPRGNGLVATIQVGGRRLRVQLDELEQRRELDRAKTGPLRVVSA